jgi:hypothetical protein
MLSDADALRALPQTGLAQVAIRALAFVGQRQSSSA